MDAVSTCSDVIVSDNVANMIKLVGVCVHLSTGDALPAVDSSRMRLYSMRFCPYAHRTKLVLEHKKIP